MIFQKFEDLELTNIPVVIFGSGPAGITTALELERKKISSIIIEAGKENFSSNSQDFYKGKIIGDNLADLSSSRLRQLGGTSGHWGGWCKPMESYNLENWPLKKNELNQYAKKTCSILNIKNKFEIASLNNYFNQIEFQYSKIRFADKYKDYLKKSKNIHLILNCQLSHFEGNNGIIQNAVCINQNSKKKVKSKYYILACGGIENSRILLWTREKNKSLINQNLPIGQYWMNHPWIISGIGIINKKKLENKLGNKFINYDGPLHFASKKKLLNDKKILSAAIYMNAKEDTKFYKEIIKDILCVAPEYGKKIARKIFSKDLKCGNIFNIPRINLFYKISEESLFTAKTFLEEFANLCKDQDLGRIAIQDNIYNLDSFENMGGYHHLGGTRMGTNNSTSVVNPDLKVHNLNNLFVNGSSNFPTAGYTNPTYTIVQLSLRLANTIASKLV